MNTYFFITDNTHCRLPEASFVAKVISKALPQDLPQLKKNTQETFNHLLNDRTFFPSLKLNLKSHLIKLIITA